MRDRTGHKSNALLRYEKPGTEQVLNMSERLGVPSNLNLSKDDVAYLVAMGSECAFDEFGCDIPDELLASIDESFLRRN